VRLDDPSDLTTNVAFKSLNMVAWLPTAALIDIAEAPNRDPRPPLRRKVRRSLAGQDVGAELGVAADVATVNGSATDLQDAIKEAAAAGDELVLSSAPPVPDHHPSGAEAPVRHSTKLIPEVPICPHDLSNYDGVLCDECSRSFPRGSDLHGCRLCDYDQCQDCNRTKSSVAARKTSLAGRDIGVEEPQRWTLSGPPVRQRAATAETTADVLLDMLRGWEESRKLSHAALLVPRRPRLLVHHRRLHCLSELKRPMCLWSSSSRMRSASRTEFLRAYSGHGRHNSLDRQRGQRRVQRPTRAAPLVANHLRSLDWTPHVVDSFQS